MNSVERVKAICKERKIPLSKMEKDLGYANGYISQLKKGVFPADRLQAISKYLGVTQDYLLDGDSTTKKYYLNEETEETAQEIFENDKVLFDVYRSADKDKLVEYAKMLKTLRDAEEGR